MAVAHLGVGWKHWPFQIAQPNSAWEKHILFPELAFAFPFVIFSHGFGLITSRSPRFWGRYTKTLTLNVGQVLLGNLTFGPNVHTVWESASFAISCH
jgi:hypothetical protein